MFDWVLSVIEGWGYPGIFALMLPFTLSKAGGFDGIRERMGDQAFNLIGDKNFGADPQTILTWFVVFTLGLLIGQDIWQRVFTARTPKVARLGGTIAGGIGILFACCCTPVGLVLGVVGAVLGHMALSAMKSSGVTTSKELATAAVAAGWTAVGLNVVMAILGVILNLGSAFGGLDTIGS